jgi:hypothetical protein
MWMIRRLWRQFTVEIVALVLAGLGVFLLLERMHIRATFLRFLKSLLATLARAISALGQGFLHMVNHVTLSDGVGVTAIAAAIWLIIWRVRWRIAHSEVLVSQVCPECGSRLHRVHRYTSDRLITWIAPLRRYRCASHDCHWTGLKVRPKETRSE